MKLRKIQAGVYEIMQNGEGIGRVADKRKANLYDLDNLHWQINFYKDREHRLHKQNFRTLKNAKKKLGL